MKVLKNYDLSTPFYGSRIVPNMTAIAGIYTSEGFALAADGRGSGSAENQHTDTAQKIFPLAIPRHNIACGISGMASIWNSESPDEPRFEFANEIVRLTTGLNSRGKSLDKVVEGICSSLAKKLRIALREEDACFSNDEPFAAGGFVIARLFFFGFYRNKPSQVTATFLHENQVVVPSFIAPVEVQLNQMSGIGSAVIASLLSEKNVGWLWSYQVAPERPPNLTLAEGTAKVKGYVEACSDPKALDLDRERCVFIGGHAHVATITKAKGFQWVTPPKTLLLG